MSTNYNTTNAAEVIFDTLEDYWNDNLFAVALHRRVNNNLIRYEVSSVGIPEMKVIYKEVYVSRKSAEKAFEAMSKHYQEKYI